MPLDAQLSEDESFLEYLEKIDAYIAANMRGYADTARDVLSNIVLTPLEPCSIFTGGLMEHWALLRSQNALFDASNMPAEGARVPQIIARESLCNTIFDGFDPVHTYVRLIDTYENRIQEFHSDILATAERFRHAIDSLINYRRLMTSMADPNLSVFNQKEINSLMKTYSDPDHIQRANDFYNKNKLDIERKINDYHFRVENLRQRLIRQFDELYARRVGWGFRMKNPGIRFLVYIRHDSCTKKPIIKEQRQKRNALVAAFNNNNNITSCIVDIDSIDLLNDEMIKDSPYSYKIVKFSERENVLKREIEHLSALFHVWLETSSGWYTSYWYLGEYKFTSKMFDLFQTDVLKNPKYNDIDHKLSIINNFSYLIKNEMMHTLNWYYDPQRSIHRVRNFIYKLYQGSYPNPPPNNGTMFHDELKKK